MFKSYSTKMDAMRIIFVISNLLCISYVIDARMNVLFLVADDMRPELGAYYGKDFPSPIHPTMHSPNLDKLASKSLLLKRAYCQQAVCSPSRTSLLTGRRPDTTHVYDLQTYWRKSGGNFTTIPQYFKENGYTSIGMGKIFHPGIASGHDDPISWSAPYFHATIHWETRENSWKAVPDYELKDKPLVDNQTAEHALGILRQVAPAAKSGEKPFFVAVGFHRPHLPFVFPESMHTQKISSSNIGLIELGISDSRIWTGKVIFVNFRDFPIVYLAVRLPVVDKGPEANHY